MLYYAGIGSRKTPEDVLTMMSNIAGQLAERWTLRSGFADGADMAFAYGAQQHNGEMENYLPWAGFNGAPNSGDPRFITPTQIDMNVQFAAMQIAKAAHPNWEACSRAARNMHTRNVHQVLGHDLNTPSQLVICWTPRASGSGGTGQAIRIARAYGIPVFDLADASCHQRLVDEVNRLEGSEKWSS